MKKLLTLAALSLTILAPWVTHAFGALSLDATMQKNAQRIVDGQKNTNETPVITPEKKKEEIDENLPRKFSYQAVKSTGNITIQKALESDIYIQEIALGKGAKIRSILPTAVSYNADINGGEPEYKRKNTKELIQMAGKYATTLTNGQFFNGNKNPTTLSFGLKSDGEVKSAGADNRWRNKKILTTINGWTKVLPHSWENLDNRSGDFAIVGFGAGVANRSNSRIGRTYLCPKNPNGRNASHTLISLVASEITDAEGIQELLKYGCQKETIVKLDGSGSSRFYYNGKTTYGFSKDKPDYRTIPHALAFYEK